MDDKTWGGRKRRKSFAESVLDGGRWSCFNLCHGNWNCYIWWEGSTEPLLVAQCIGEIHQDVDIKYQVGSNWIKGTEWKAILANTFPVFEEDTKEDAFYRLLYWTVKNAEGSDPGNSKILVFANSKSLGRPHITGTDSKLTFRHVLA